MVTKEIFTQLALSLPESAEAPHFDNTSFRINKKIFATLSAKNNTACVKLTDIDQSAFCSFDPTIIYPVPNKWGRQGWTNINLDKVQEEMLLDALTTAYSCIAPKRLAQAYKDRNSIL